MITEVSVRNHLDSQQRNISANQISSIYEYNTAVKILCIQTVD